MIFYLTLGLLALVLILLIAIYNKVSAQSRTNTEQLIKDMLGAQFKENREELASALRQNREELSKNVKDNRDELTLALKNFSETMSSKQGELLKSTEEKLEKMRETVDEKLHKTLEERLGQSFKLVSERLEAVQKGLGEMQNLASGVGDLKKVLSNVKTRGVLGEIQLGNILEQIMAPEQYAANVKTKKAPMTTSSLPSNYRAKTTSAKKCICP